MRVLRSLLWVIAATAIIAAGLWFYALHTTSGARLIWSQVEGAANGALSANKIDGDVASGLNISGLRYRGDGVSVSVARFSAAIDIGLFPLAVDVVVARAASVEVEIRDTGGVEEGESDIGESDIGESDIGETLNALVLPLPVRLSDLQAEDIVIDSAGDVLEIQRLELIALWHEDINIEKLRVQNDDIDTSMDAHISLAQSPAFMLNARAVAAPNLTGLSDSLQLSARGSGNLEGVKVVAEVGDFAKIDGSVHWADNLAVEADVSLSGFSPDLLGVDWPQAFPIDGQFHASLDEARVVISQSQLRIPAANAFVAVDANLDRHTEQVAGTLSWTSLRWPLPKEQVRVRSDAGDIRVSGTVDSWTVVGNVGVGTEQMPDGRFTLDAAGTRDGASARIIKGSLLGGTAVGEVEYEWRDEHPWSAVLDIAAIELASLAPDWPGSLSGHVDGSGTARPFSLQATLADVNGRIRGIQLTANGAIEIQGDNVTAQDLRIEHGESRVSLDGSLTTREGLHFNAVLADVGDYVDDARGRLEALGHVSATDSALALSLSASSPMLAYGENELAGVALTIEGTGEQQSLHLDAERRGTSFMLGLSGAFDDWHRPLESAWNGNIGAFEIDLDDEHSLSLAHAVPISLSKEDITVQDFCIGDQTGAHLCAGFEWQDSGDYAANLVVQEIPVRIVEHAVETGLNFDQRVSGQLNWRKKPQGRGSGGGRLRMSAGTVSSTENASLSVQTGEGTIDFVIENGALLSAELDLPMPGTGTVTGRLALGDVTRIGDSEISGSLDADISDVAVLSLLLPMIDSAVGRLRVRAELEGTLEEPRLAGELELKGASMEYRPIGLALQDMNLTGHLDGNHQVDLVGSFRSGSGIGKIVSSADFSDISNPGLRINLQGEGLTLIDVPDVFVTVNSDINVTLSPGALSIDGTLLVPAARIKPTSLAVSRINESSDVVIMAGELPHPPEKDASNSNIEFSGNLDVQMGDSVVVVLDRARAAITGGAVFAWQGDAVPVAKGRFDIAGNVSAFGQVLDIKEGSVRFPSVPADSPNIRIVAEREIYGNTQVKRAGVLIEGPIRRLKIDPFTVPMTTEERALTLLVTGSDFDFEQGVGAIDFGTYIAPRLFVSYGVGVFERENIVSARFDLSQRFGIKASSGSKESGVDLNYRFEN